MVRIRTVPINFQKSSRAQADIYDCTSAGPELAGRGLARRNSDTDCDFDMNEFNLDLSMSPLNVHAHAFATQLARVRPFYLKQAYMVFKTSLHG